MHSSGFDCYCSFSSVYDFLEPISQAEESTFLLGIQITLVSKLDSGSVHCVAMCYKTDIRRAVETGDTLSKKYRFGT